MYALEAQDIRKSYGGIRALAGVGLAIRPGSVHALLGENGAGKSTLVKVMTGATRPDSGVLRLDGREVRFGSTAEAVHNGVAVVSQELSLFPHLSVLANLFPMREPRRGPLVDRSRMQRLAAPVLADLGLHVPTRALVHELPLAERQLVEIAKALISKPRVLLLDEPTSALEARATQRLLGIIRVLRERKVAVVFVSHILEEVMSLCDEVTVLRDGEAVIHGEPIARHTMTSIVTSMIGDRSTAARAATLQALPLVTDAAGALRVEGVSLAGGVHDVSLTASPGEVVGLAGLDGSGPAEILRAIAGIERPVRGTITLPGGRPAPRGQRANIAAGVAYVSGDRRRIGLMLDKPLWENIVQVRSMAMGRDGVLLNRRKLIARARERIAQLGIRTPSAAVAAGSLSGGNQQKAVVAKWLDDEPTVILLDDPTRGVDIGARAEIHALLRGAAQAGAVVLLCSTDLEELANTSDRVLVFYRGRICAELRGDDMTARNMLQLMNTGEAPIAAE